MTEFLRRLGYLIHRRRYDRELAGDLEFHREMADREGSQPVGNTLRWREEAREAWGWTWLDRFGQDLRYALRMLRKSPGFTAAAVGMLALGIGVNVAVFGFFDLIVLRPLQIRQPETLLRLHRRAPQGYAFVLPYPETEFFREYAKTLSAVLVLNVSKLAIEGEPKQLTAHFVSANFFRDLGAAASLGRMLDPARDEAADAGPVVVLSHGFWQRHFGGDYAIVGKTVRLNGKAATVVGVAPPGVSSLSLDSPDLWAPIRQQPFFATGSHLLTDFAADGSGVEMWGRLLPGVSPRAAEEELRSLAAELRRQHPLDIWERESVPSEPGGYAKSLMIGGRRGTGSEGADELYPIFAMVGALGLLILGVACGNLGSLLLARGVAREREIGIRVAVGAGSGRLIRQLFTESLVLALTGSVAGLGAGYLVLRGLMAWTGAAAWLDPSPDWRVAAFALGVGCAAAVLFGLTPALQVARQRHRSGAARQFLIGAQVAASCVLLIVAGLLVRALDHAMSDHPGFEYEQVISIDAGLGAHGYSPAKARAYLDVLKGRLNALPEVESVSLATSAPLGNRREMAGLEVGGRALTIQINRVDPEFFQTMRIPLVRGRSLTRGDAHGMVISQSLARLAWPGRDPVGRQFTMGSEYTVVGVSGSARLVAFENSDAVETYQLAEEADLPGLIVLVKTRGPAEGAVPLLAAVARPLDPLVFPEIQMLKNSFRQKLQAAERGAVAVSLLGFTALLLACLGIVGLVGYAVSQRTKEIGIRMALGARPADVLLVVLRQFSWPVALGLATGVGAAAAVSQVLRQILYGVSNLDPAAYAAAIGIFAGTAAVAALVPARQALRVDPVKALRDA